MKTLIMLLALFSLTVGSAYATTHTITFSGKKYSPKSLTVSVGDTIVWQGDFDAHPLTLTKAPAGAATFAHIEKGSSYSYIITVAGNYEYICDMHVDEGMSGSFTAAGSGTKIEY